MKPQRGGVLWRPADHRRQPMPRVDVQEHAYYIDYHNARPKFAETFFDKLVNWDFAAENLA